MYRNDGHGIGGVVLSGYLLTVIGTILLCAVLTAIVPEGQTAGMIKGTAKLACLLAIVSPIPELLRVEKSSEINFSQTVIETDAEFIQYYCEMRIRQTKEHIEKTILSEYGLQTDVALAWEYTEKQAELYTIKTITVQMQQNTTEEVERAVCEYLTKNYCSEVLIE